MAESAGRCRHTAKLRRVIIAARFSDFTLTSQNAQKSMTSAWPGKTPKTSLPKPRKSSSRYALTNL
jgi:hypothetical protein